MVLIKKLVKIKNNKIMNFINSWAKGNKKSTKIDIEVRLGRITVLKLMLDFGNEYELMVLNFGVCVCHGS